MAQQTAIEWLIEKIAEDYPEIPRAYREEYQKAKAMEKEQMHKCASFWRGKENEIEKPMFDLYYNETYNK
jgi:hypothetical protein